MTAIVLQARLDSKRLPEKAMLLLDGKPLLFRVMQALNHVPADKRILACPEDSSLAFTPLAEEAGFKIHSGPKDDVLERYCQVIRRFGIRRVIRATGDNPFVFADAAESINEEASARTADYAGYIDLPVGAGVESVSAAALQRAVTDGADSFDREHVCPFLYNHENLYKVYRPCAPEKWRAPHLRLTVDTQEDFERAQELYAALKDIPNRYTGTAIIETCKGLGYMG